MPQWLNWPNSKKSDLQPVKIRVSNTHWPPYFFPEIVSFSRVDPVFHSTSP